MQSDLRSVVVRNLKEFIYFVEVMLCFKAGARSQSEVARVFEYDSFESRNEELTYSSASVCRGVRFVTVRLCRLGHVGRETDLFCTRGIGTTKIPSAQCLKVFEDIREILDQLGMLGESFVESRITRFANLLEEIRINGPFSA
jgi:hypothetical protein